MEVSWQRRPWKLNLDLKKEEWVPPPFIILFLYNVHTLQLALLRSYVVTIHKVPRDNNAWNARLVTMPPVRSRGRQWGYSDEFPVSNWSLLYNLVSKCPLISNHHERKSEKYCLHAPPTLPSTNSGLSKP